MDRWHLSNEIFRRSPAWWNGVVLKLWSGWHCSMIFGFSHEGRSLLPPSGDIGTGLVWYNHPPQPNTPSTFWSDCWNPLQAELNYLWYDGSSIVLRMISHEFRCFPMFSAVFWCFQLGCNFYRIAPCAMHNHPCAHILWSYLYEVWQDQDALVG